MKRTLHMEIIIQIQVKFPSRDIIALSSHRDEFYEEGRAVVSIARLLTILLYLVTTISR
jgi:hypothetical protein